MKNTEPNTQPDNCNISTPPLNPGSYPKAWLDKIDNLADYSTSNGLPGAVLNFGIQGSSIFKKSYGFQRTYNEKVPMPNPESMSTDTLFDLASLTKIFSTMLGFMLLVDRGLISISDKVQKHLPTFTNPDVTLEQLLNHNSGLPATYDFYNPKKVPASFYSQERSKTIELLPKVPLINKPGTVTVYSDINYMLLGIILEQVTGKTQDIFLAEEIYKPLQLMHTGYKLLEKGFKPSQFEATERCGNTRDGFVSFPNVRTQTLQGEVQDEKAYYSMGQVSGHAGLFSNADDLSVLCQLLLGKGTYHSFKAFSEATADLFFETKNIDASYALGLQIPSPSTALIYGTMLPYAGNSLGHTGWTGNCFLIDFQHQSYAILLNNKRHSPVINVYNETLKFEGNLLPASIYGGIMQLFYAGLVIAG